MDKHILLIAPAIIGISAIAAFLIVANTMPVVLVFIPGVVFAFILYMATYYRRAIPVRRILPLYLIALAIQFLHFTEEYLADFPVRLPTLLGQEPYPVDYWVTFNMVAYTIFILGAIALYLEKREWTIIPLFFILVGVMFNAIAHVLTSLYVGGYFPGLYTAIIYLVLGPVLIRRLLTPKLA